MKLFFVYFLLFSLNLFACSGDCVACHPTLLNNEGKMDSDHQILQRCKTCHRDGSKIVLVDSNTSKIHFKIIKIKSVDENSHTECGSDCWQCHDINKVGRVTIPEHKHLQKCIACHMQLDKNLLQLDTTESDDTLQDFLKR